MTMTKRKESTSSRGPVKGDSSRRPEQDYPNVADWNHNYDIRQNWRITKKYKEICEKSKKYFLAIAVLVYTCVNDV